MLMLALQWAGSLFRELDYTKEAANGVRFRELYSRLEVCLLMHVLCISCHNSWCYSECTTDPARCL